MEVGAAVGLNLFIPRPEDKCRGWGDCRLEPIHSTIGE